MNYIMLLGGKVIGFGDFSVFFKIINHIPTEKDKHIFLEEVKNKYCNNLFNEIQDDYLVLNNVKYVEINNDTIGTLDSLKSSYIHSLQNNKVC